MYHLSFAPLLALTLSTTGPQDPAPPQPPSSLVARSEHFVFHSHPWVGLHHFLYEWARSEAERSPRDTRPAPRIPEKGALAEWSDGELAEWSAVVEHYREHAVPSSLLFDSRLLEVKRLLCAVDPDATRLTDEELEALGDFGEALAAAMPVFRKHFWQAHDRSNRAWITEQTKALERYERALAAGLLRAYGGTWTEDRIRIDVAAYTNWAGAYATNRPNHVMMSSTDEDMQGWNGLESIVHEVSHTSPLEGGHVDAVSAAFEAIDAEAPERLWHALVFYTAGELTRAALERDGVEGFRPYAEKAGFYERPSWAGYRAAFDAHWKPMLDGELPRADAYAGVARALCGR